MSRQEIYGLGNGEPVASLCRFPSPLAEYRAAFAETSLPFLYYYTFYEGEIAVRPFTRGEFWTLAEAAAANLAQRGIKKGDRIVHCFSRNTAYDLIFRLAAVFTGSIPVTTNWQADDNDRITYKTTVTEAKLIIYDRGFADRIAEMKPGLNGVPSLAVEGIEHGKPDCPWHQANPDWEDEKIIIFTSGTTDVPKGVTHPHRSYLGNRLSFEDWLYMTPDTRLDLLLVNPMHHANSTALSDWGLRRKNAIIHLVERYSTAYWKIIPEVATRKRDLVFVSVVARHFDFLRSLVDEGKLPLAESELKAALKAVDIMIGSAPVGPKTVKFVLDFVGKLPRVRYGSTETCLQVVGTPTQAPHNTLLESFQAGWAHQYLGKPAPGFYIGRDHTPFTRVRAVKSVDPDTEGYMQTCEDGEPGYLVAQGPNVMKGYVNNPEATEAVLESGWYTGLRDIVFTLKNPHDGKHDYYWMSRDSELLIRGGANYAYDQVASVLSQFLTERFKLEPEEFQLAVIGLRLKSEHDDSCCVTIELKEASSRIVRELETAFLNEAPQAVPKGCQPDFMRLGRIPRNFKGAILYRQLKQEFMDAIQQ